jgi:hypothetical protein
VCVRGVDCFLLYQYQRLHINKKKKDVHEDKILDKLQNFNLMVTTVQTKILI